VVLLGRLAVRLADQRRVIDFLRRWGSCGPTRLGLGRRCTQHHRHGGLLTMRRLLANRIGSSTRPQVEPCKHDQQTDTEEQ